MTTDAAPAWDPSLPVLARLLARMEALGASLVRVEEEQALFQRMGSEGTLGAMLTQVREPFRLGDLLDEQVGPSEAFLAALSGATSEFSVTARTRIPTLVPVPVPEEGHVLTLRVQVRWAVPRGMYLHLPLIPDRAAP